VRSGDYEGAHARRRGLRAVVNRWLEEISFRTGMTMAAVALVIVAGIAVGAVLLPGNGHASDRKPTVADPRPVVATTASPSPAKPPTAPTTTAAATATATEAPPATSAPAATTTAAAPSPTPSTRQPTETPSPTASPTPTLPDPFPTVPGCHHRHFCGGLRGHRHRDPAADRWPGEYWALGPHRDPGSVG
jgi:hypothetical protein